jgi:beta-lactam-binding protein with PASTA domain
MSKYLEESYDSALKEIEQLKVKLKEVENEKDEWFSSGMFQTRRADLLGEKLQIAQKALEESTFVLNEIRDTKCNELAKRNMVILDQLKER